MKDNGLKKKLKPGRVGKIMRKRDFSNYILEGEFIKNINTLRVLFERVKKGNGGDIYSFINNIASTLRGEEFEKLVETVEEFIEDLISSDLSKRSFSLRDGLYSLLLYHLIENSMKSKKYEKLLNKFIVKISEKMGIKEVLLSAFEKLSEEAKLNLLNLLYFWARENDPKISFQLGLKGKRSPFLYVNCLFYLAQKEEMAVKKLSELAYIGVDTALPSLATLLLIDDETLVKNISFYFVSRYHKPINQSYSFYEVSSFLESAFLAIKKFVKTKDKDMERALISYAKLIIENNPLPEAFDIKVSKDVEKIFNLASATQ